MSFKSKVLAAAATLTLVSGVGMAGALTAEPAGAATPSCGILCVNLFSFQFGTHANPAFTVDVFRQGEKVGQPIILFRTANYDPALDWTFNFQGTVADFFAAGLVSSSLALHYGCLAGVDFATCPFNIAGFNIPSGGDSNLLAVENEYSPFGVNSGLCLGVAATAFQGEGVTLQPCGVSGRTIWIVDDNESFFHNFPGVPLINGSNTNFSHPFVLTYPNNSFPTDMPRPQLTVTNLTGFSNASPPFFIPGPELGTVNVNQLWGADFGILK